MSIIIKGLPVLIILPCADAISTGVGKGDFVSCGAARQRAALDNIADKTKIIREKNGLNILPPCIRLIDTKIII